ncbi:hypothetical protein [Pedobacter psychroterrae]|uniref:Lipocalin-like protein n=1 Tax=Pedobacter psychroterrae TaxID=2530453 RepID=A0A4R0NN77_9SPHI|nr:hypothetical protein [Pedobacter psychroterrae]TCD01398.1 hypothetical protein EZ437_11675 [Pedobacter psychroterrae]
MINRIKSLIWIIVVLTTTGTSQAQSNQKQTQKQVEKLYSGLWTDKQTTRQLEISFQYGYATITDWTSKFQKRESGDIYQGSIKNGKLIMPEDTQHRAPYSEILYKNNTLIYLTKSIDSGKTLEWDKRVFTRVISKSQ